MTERKISAEHMQVHHLEKLTPRTLAEAAFKAGWLAACDTMARLMREAGASPGVIEATMRMGQHPPTPTIEFADSSGTH